MEPLPVELLQRVGVVAALVISLAVASALDRPSALGARLRRRFVLGVPWGTLVTVGLVLAVYLFLQGGYGNWYSPVTIPFRAWSYFYPLGIASAAFSHGGAGHLVGNLVGTLTLAPLAEYAWGHFPRERGAHSFGSPRTNPYVRAFVVFPVVVVAVGLLTSAFAIGPIIGFSGVVFAFAGVALVNYPLGTVVALAAGGALRLVYNALRAPVLTASGRPGYITPWWADIAIQGHALGLLIGVLVGLVIVRARTRDGRPSARRLWLGTLLFAVEQSLWAVYWFRGGETYVLYRAAGVILVAALALVVVFAAVARDDPLFTWELLGDSGVVRNWQVAAGVLLLSTAAIAGPAVPANLFTAESGDLPGEELMVRDYEVTYAEDVENGLVAVVDVEAFGETTAVNTSGVIVRSEERGIWTTTVTKGRLAFDGQAAVRLGGVGWRETVYAQRDGWNVLGNGTAYRVALGDKESGRVVYTSDPVTAAPTLAERNVTVVPTENRYLLRVDRGNDSLSTRMPAKNESVTLDGLTFTRNDSRVFVSYDGTRLQLLAKETYE
ncbi:rhomboid family intramembrane serine protease [Halobellus limi]|uniref:Membrane associated serine protease, rhomboid family n=1 Tax=Halobellus limi TaxID=699433 RepID=A0A1H6A0L8_9EURY|nr:rhomboid family intramembrane serine protease [Halobellus limi]QCC47890.1 rhomboid family intramembrane serine protease [Halobellus limi]SEG41256.1 Membrane associated serine protease, rhomboid family [Halobellus limi]